jgi:uncharacterized protein YjgD (DUF1641 family)
MTIASTPPSVDERLDQLAAQLAEITGELRKQREERERWAELADDLAPVATQAMTMVTNRLETDPIEPSDAISLAQAVVRDAAVLESWLGPLRVASALADELGPLAAPAVGTLTTRLQQLDERGYFSFARQAASIADTVVTSFTEEDVRQLGDNIVLILQTVKQMTQPEVMGMLRRTAVTIQEGEAEGPIHAPSTLALLRQMRDPLVRRGLARALATLRALGAEPELVAKAAITGKR